MGLFLGHIFAFFICVFAVDFGHSGVTPGPFLGHFWVTPGSFLDHFGVTPGSFSGHFWVTLGSLPGHFSVILGSLPDHFWNIFGSPPDHFRVISLYINSYIKRPINRPKRPPKIATAFIRYSYPISILSTRYSGPPWAQHRPEGCQMKQKWAQMDPRGSKTV